MSDYEPSAPERTPYGGFLSFPLRRFGTAAAAGLLGLSGLLVYFAAFRHGTTYPQECAVKRLLKLGGRADHARDAGDWINAAELYRQVLELNRERPDIWVQYGHALKQLGRVGEALDAYSSALELEPKTADIWVQYGHALKQLGRVGEALDAYSSALELEPKTADIYVQIAHALKLQGKLQHSANSYLTALRLDPSSSEALAELKAFGFSPNEIDDVLQNGKPLTWPPKAVSSPAYVSKLAIQRSLAVRASGEPQTQSEAREGVRTEEHMADKMAGRPVIPFPAGTYTRETLPPLSEDARQILERAKNRNPPDDHKGEKSSITGFRFLGKRPPGFRLLGKRPAGLHLPERTEDGDETE